MDARKVDVYRITEMREGCVYKTRKITTIWIPLQLTEEQELEIARSWGGDILATRTDMVFGVKFCKATGQTEEPK